VERESIIVRIHNNIRLFLTIFSNVLIFCLTAPIAENSGQVRGSEGAEAADEDEDEALEEDEEDGDDIELGEEEEEPKREMVSPKKTAADHHKMQSIYILTRYPGRDGHQHASIAIAAVSGSTDSSYFQKVSKDGRSLILAYSPPAIFYHTTWIYESDPDLREDSARILNWEGEITDRFGKIEEGSFPKFYQTIKLPFPVLQDVDDAFLYNIPHPDHPMMVFQIYHIRLKSIELVAIRGRQTGTMTLTSPLRGATGGIPRPPDRPPPPAARPAPPAARPRPPNEAHRHARGADPRMYAYPAEHVQFDQHNYVGNAGVPNTGNNMMFRHRNISDDMSFDSDYIDPDL
jgi:hypothetical protein